MGFLKKTLLDGSTVMATVARASSYVIVPGLLGGFFALKLANIIRESEREENTFVAHVDAGNYETANTLFTRDIGESDSQDIEGSDSQDIEGSDSQDQRSFILSHALAGDIDYEQAANYWRFHHQDQRGENLELKRWETQEKISTNLEKIVAEDGKEFLVVGDSKGILYFFNNENHGSVNIHPEIHSKINVVERDGSQKAVVNTRWGGIYEVSLVTSELESEDQESTLYEAATRIIYDARENIGPITVSDVDQDGNPDYLFAKAESNEVTAINSDGEVIYSAPMGGVNLATNFSPILLDVDEDLEGLEVLMPSKSGNSLYYSSLGDPEKKEQRIDLDEDKGKVTKQPVIGDFNRDGSQDLVVVRESQTRFLDPKNNVMRKLFNDGDDHPYTRATVFPMPLPLYGDEAQVSDSLIVAGKENWTLLINNPEKPLLQRTLEQEVSGNLSAVTVGDIMGIGLGRNQFIYATDENQLAISTIDDAIGGSPASYKIDLPGKARHDTLEVQYLNGNRYLFFAHDNHLHMIGDGWFKQDKEKATMPHYVEDSE